MEPHTIRQLGLVEEAPCGLADDFVWSVTQDVNNAVRRVQNCGIVRKVLEQLVSSTGGQQRYVPWMVMKVISMIAVNGMAMNRFWGKSMRLVQQRGPSISSVDLKAQSWKELVIRTAFSQSTESRGKVEMQGGERVRWMSYIPAPSLLLGPLSIAMIGKRLKTNASWWNDVKSLNPVPSTWR
jgi:hypothetical protein